MRAEPTNNPLCIKILNTPLEEKIATKYLGVIIDQNLNWSTQTQNTNLKISKGIGMLAKLRHYVPLQNLIQMYFAFIQSQSNHTWIMLF